MTERLRRKAAFCMATGVPPNQYESLTLAEYSAFLDVLNDQRN